VPKGFKRGANFHFKCQLFKMYANSSYLMALKSTAKRAKERKLDMEYAIFGLERDTDVKNLSDKFTSKFLIGLGNGKSITTKEIYNITYLENDLKFKELSSKDRLYKKVDTRV